MVSRRGFLKVAGGTAALAVVNPFKAFAGFIPDDIKEGENVFSLGLGNVCIGSAIANLHEKDICLKKTGLATIKIRTFTDFNKPMNGFPTANDFQVSMSSEIVAECFFKKEPNIFGSVGRVEVVVMYPDGHNFMAIIFPKARMTRKKDMFVFTSIPVKHETWKDMPLGRFYWDRK